MNTPWTSWNPWTPDSDRADFKIANLRAQFRERREERFSRTNSMTLVQDIEWAVSNTVSPRENTGNWHTQQIQSWVDTVTDSDNPETEGWLVIDFNVLEAQSNRTVLDVFGDSKMNNSSIQSIDRTKLKEGITKIEMVSLNKKERFTLVYSRLSHGRDIATREQFLKFENETHECIWNGIIKWKKSVWWMRPKGSQKKYFPVRWISAEKVTYE